MRTKLSYCAVALLLVLNLTITGAKDSCCVEEDFPSDCHYLCNDNDVSFWTETKCAFYRGKLYICKAKRKAEKFYDVVKIFGDEFKADVQESWAKLDENVKEKLADAKEFSKATVEQIRKLPQDLLSALHTLKGMTTDQFKGIMNRFKDFTSSNLRHILKRVELSVIFDSIKDLGNYAWDRSQLAALVETVYRKFGENIENWSAEQLKNLGVILAGLPSSDFAKFSANAFDGSLEKLCEVRLSFYKKLNSMTPAIKIFGKYSEWNSTAITRMCNLVEALTPEQILELKADELSKALSKLAEFKFTRSQQEAFLRRLKDELGDISKWSVDKIKELKSFVQEIEVEDIKKLNKDQLKKLVEEHALNIWDETQKLAVYKNLVEKYGEPETWSEELLEKSVDLLNGLSKKDLTKIGTATLVKALEFGTKVKWTQVQAEALLKVLNGEKSIASLSKDGIVGLGGLLIAFSGTDAGKLTKNALFLAFPELIPVVGIGEPVLRYFIKVYKEESKNGEIKSLGQFAKALTREEISQQQIQDLLSNLEELVDVDFDEAQIAEFMIKLRTSLGNLNNTGKQDLEVQPWGFQNLRKFGKVILGFTRDELKNFPIYGIDDTIEVLGKQDKWKRRMVLTAYKRVKSYWTSLNTTVADYTEAKLEALGKFVQGLTIEELDQLTDQIKVIAIQKLGEYTGLPDDKLKSRAFFAFEHLKKLRGGKLTASDLKLLGNLISGLPKEYIDQIDNSVLYNNLKDLLNNHNLKVDSLKKIVEKVKSHLQQTDIGKWNVDQLKKLGKALNTLDSNDLKKMTKEVFDEISGQLGTLEWNQEQLNALVDKAKESWGADVGQWSEKQLHRLGSIINGLSNADIGKISQEAFEQTVGEFGNGIKVTKEKQRELAKRLQVLITNLLNMDLNMVKRFRNLLSGFSADDLMNLKINSLDILNQLGEVDDWSTDQVSVLAKKAKTYLSTVQSSDGFMNVKNLIKGYLPDDIKLITTESFKLAAGKLGKVSRLSIKQKQELVKKAKEAWGNDISTWSGGKINEAGHFLDGLSNEDLGKINPTHISYIRPNVIGNMANSDIQAFTEEQLSEFSIEQNAAVTMEQKISLSAPQVAALKSVDDEDPTEKDPFKDNTTGAAATYHGTTLALFAGIFTCLITYWVM